MPNAGHPDQPWTVALYGALARLCTWLLCAMAVFSPWAFGTTESWSIAIMNVGGWSLGAVFLIRWMLRQKLGMQRSKTIAVTVLGWLTLVLLLYTVIAAW